jgi:FkbM family methyltransferase
LLSRIPYFYSYLQKAKFISKTGTAVTLDMTSDEFFFLSGIHPSEPLEISLLQRLIRPNDIFIDVGANIGLYILHIISILNKNGRYYAFEPDKINFNFINSTYSAPNLFLSSLALSNVIGHANFLRVNSLEAKITNIHSQETFEIQTTRLDQFLLKLDPLDTVIVKIDVEGHESAVLKGMNGFFLKGIQPIVMIEFLPIQSGRVSIAEELNNYYDKKAKIYAISEKFGGLFEVSLREPIPSHVLNLLIVPNTLATRLNDIFIK